MSQDLLVTSRRLAKASPRRPRQADLKRAVSTAYYALFIEMCKNMADMLVGATPAYRSDAAWAQAYRGLDHGPAKSKCGEVRNLGFPPDICRCADHFIELQEARHAADYDPFNRITRADAIASVIQAETAMRLLRRAERRHRRAFAVHLVFKRRH